MHGNVRYVAEKVAKGLGADLIEIKPVKAYPDKGAMQIIWGGSAWAAPYYMIGSLW